MVISDVITFFGCDTTFPHECRRSGLNEGTMRKFRLVEDAVDEGTSRSRFVSNDMMKNTERENSSLFLFSRAVMKIQDV